MRWTPEARARQAERIREWKPWEQSTGPKTDEGKRISRMNALKSAEDIRRMYLVYSALMRALAEKPVECLNSGEDTD